MEGNECVQRLDLAEISTMSTLQLEKDTNIGLETWDVRMSLRKEHFQNAARGPLKYMGPGPSAPHFENVHFETKTKEGGDPLFTWVQDRSRIGIG